MYLRYGYGNANIEVPVNNHIDAAEALCTGHRQQFVEHSDTHS